MRVWIAVLFFGVLLGNKVYADAPIMLATGEFAPYAGSHLPEGGFLNDLVVSAFEEEGMEVNKLFLPWARGFLGVQKQHFDITAPYIWTEQRAATLLYSDPVYELAVTVFVRDEDTSRFHRPDDFIGYSWCLPRTYATYVLDPYLQKGLMRLVRASSDKACMEMVAKERVTAYAVDMLIGQQLLKDNPELFGGISNLSWAINKNSYHLMISKDHPRGKEILQRFNRGMEKLKASGKWQAILQRHGIDGRPIDLPQTPMEDLEVFKN